ncbi:MAG: MFS transporter [Actinobacteria bacterium]|nr:MFS transporter [Actinomycetota bacterium]
MTDADTAPEEAAEQRWLTPGVRGIGGASLLADVGHEIPTSLLPALLTGTLGAPAAALGIIEGVADGLAGAARFGGGALADDPGRRRAIAVGGYGTTAVLSGLIGVATSVWHVAILRSGAWFARGLRVPARNALLADVVPAGAYGRAYGFERAMDNLGAILGPLLGIALVAAVGIRGAMLLSIIPGLLAVGAIVYAIRAAKLPRIKERQPIRIQVRPVLHGELGRLLGAVAAFELGNIAATLLILRATELLTPGHSTETAAQLALALYTTYNVAATLISIPAGRHSDRRNPVQVLVAGTAAFGAAYIVLALTGASLPILAIGFILAGIGIGCVETAEHAAVASLAPEQLRGSAFGLLATVQSTLVSPSAAFIYAAGWMLIALAAFTRARTPRQA